MGTVQGIGTVTENVRGSRYDRLKKIGKRMYIFSGIGNTVSVNKREKNNYLSSPFYPAHVLSQYVGRIFVDKSRVLQHGIFLHMSSLNAFTPVLHHFFSSLPDPLRFFR